MNVNAERETREVRSTEDGATTGANDAGRKGGPRSTSGSSEHIGVRASGAVGPWGNLPNAVAGGIISQLIADTRDRLAEAEECITWYTRERDKCLKRLENLEHLQQLAEGEPEG